MISSIMRFSIGAIIGIVIAAAYWQMTIYFDYPLTFTRGVLGCLAIGTMCGLVILRWGYQVLETLLDTLPK